MLHFCKCCYTIVVTNHSTAEPGRVVDMLLFQCLASLPAYISIRFFDPVCRASNAQLEALMIYFPDSLTLSAFGIPCEYPVARVII